MVTRFVSGAAGTTAHLSPRGGAVQLVVGPGNYLTLTPELMRAFARSLDTMADEMER